MEHSSQETATRLRRFFVEAIEFLDKHLNNAAIEKFDAQFTLDQKVQAFLKTSVEFMMRLYKPATGVQVILQLVDIIKKNLSKNSHRRERALPILDSPFKSEI